LTTPRPEGRGFRPSPAGVGLAALVFGPPAPLELLLVGGMPVVERGELRTIDMTVATREVRAARRRLEHITAK
jgi:hypothetical protein